MKMNINQGMEETILEASEKLFLEKGFAMTSTTEIAKIVGCNQALIHYYFRTKSNLFNRIFENKFNAFFQVVFKTQNLANLDFTGKIRYFIESHFDMLSKNPKLPMLILSELTRQPEQIILLREKLHSLPEKIIIELSKDLSEEIENGNIRPISLMDLFITAISLNVSLFLMMPALETIFNLTEDEKLKLYSHRKAENVDFILKSLRV